MSGLDELSHLVTYLKRIGGCQDGVLGVAAKVWHFTSQFAVVDGGVQLEWVTQASQYCN
ncbi:MAG: hypothetical protein NZ821_02970 [Gloeomargarita sp. SKYB31]|nr:hypothetical protein [Gloeomargarita sp. SKYB31]